jgi:hypothetical protein
MTDEDQRLHGVFKGILNGINERGDGGVLFVKGDECAYRFASEFTNEEFRGALSTVLENDDNQHFFVVEERDKQLNVLAYPKTRVWSDLLKNAESGQKPKTKETRITEISTEDTLTDEKYTGTCSACHSKDTCA